MELFIINKEETRWTTVCMSFTPAKKKTLNILIYAQKRYTQTNNESLGKKKKRRFRSKKSK